MSGNCGHGWGYHSQGAAGPCDKCEKEKKLLAERDALRSVLLEARSYINESSGAEFASDLISKIDAALAKVR